MEFALMILAHMLGDYMFQNDWMALNKNVRDDEKWYTRRGLLNCIVHCLVYTLCVAIVGWIGALAWGVRPCGALGLLFVFVTHFAVDRWRLAHVWMDVYGQRGFKENMQPWSTIVVDNTIHLLCSFIVAVFYTLVPLTWWL